MESPTRTDGTGSDESLWNADDDPELEREDNFCTVTKLQQKQQMALFLRKSGKFPSGSGWDHRRFHPYSLGDNIALEINWCLIENGLSITFDGLPGIFDNQNTLNPFNGLQSKYKQEKFYR